ncbi:MAG: PKD domain-containing protein [Candidatus Bathyarchaeia archaeon]
MKKFIRNLSFVMLLLALEVSIMLVTVKAEIQPYMFHYEDYLVPSSNWKVDVNGNVWILCSTTNQLRFLMVEAETGNQLTYPLPPNIYFDKWDIDSNLKIWTARCNSTHLEIYSFDTATGAITRKPYYVGGPIWLSNIVVGKNGLVYLENNNPTPGYGDYRCLYEYNPVTNALMVYPTPDVCNIEAKYVDGQGNIWIRAGFQYIYKFDIATKKYTRYKIPLIEASLFPRSLCVDNSGMVWMILANGHSWGIYPFVKYDPKTNRIEQINIFPIQDQSDHMLDVDQQGIIWITDTHSGNRRILLFDPSTKTVIHEINLYPFVPSQVKPNPKGGMWISKYYAASYYVSLYNRDNQSPETEVNIDDGVLGQNGWYTSDVQISLHGSDLTNDLTDGATVETKVAVNGGEWQTYYKDLGYQPQTLFYDDFSSAKQEWIVESGAWTINNGIYNVSSGAGVVAKSLISGSDLLDDWNLTAYVKFQGWNMQGGGLIFGYDQSTNSYYAVRINYGESYLLVVKNGVIVLRRYFSGSMRPNKWYALSVKKVGGIFQITVKSLDTYWLEGMLFFDPEATNGKFGLIAWADYGQSAIVQFDNVTIQRSVRQEISMGALTVSQDGVNTIMYYSIDKAGNIESTKQTTIKIDKTPPQTTAILVGEQAPSGIYISDVVVNLQAVDETSGVNRTYYSLNGATSTEGTTLTVSTAGDHTVSFYSTDIAGNQEAPSTITFSINKPPVASISCPESVNEGEQIQLDATGSYDPDGTITAYDWDLDSDGEYDDAHGSIVSIPAIDDGVVTASVKVIDLYSSTDTATVTVSVLNVAPNVEAGENHLVNEGELVNFAGNFSDPGTADAHTVTWSFGDGSTCTGSLTPTHKYDNEGTYTVTLTVTDDDGGSSSDSFIVTVRNVAPVLSQVVASADPLLINTQITANANFTDQGFLDSHTAIWDWGDGTSSAGTILETEGSGLVKGQHAYTAAGVYTVTLTVMDDYGDFGTAKFEYVIVYNPSAGFITGGGWIQSPAGAYAADPALKGKATFAFVSNYHKGASVPTGNIEFLLPVAGFKFKGACYDWLVVSGNKAICKGSGTVNGAGDYGFILSIIDGGSKDGDMFRIRIWDIETGVTVYDNQLGDPDTADLSTVISGGSIVIHK